MKARVCKVLAYAGMVVMVALLSVQQVEAKSVPKLNATKKTLFVGEKKKIKVKNADSEITWKSSDKNVAKVNKKGAVTGLSEGTVTISATFQEEGKEQKTVLTCKVTIEKPEFPLHKGYYDYDSEEFSHFNREVFSLSNEDGTVNVKFDAKNSKKGNIKFSHFEGSSSAMVVVKIDGVTYEQGSIKVVRPDSSCFSADDEMGYDYAGGKKHTPYEGMTFFTDEYWNYEEYEMGAWKEIADGTVVLVQFASYENLVTVPDKVFAAIFEAIDGIE